jgi:hypothetical protein
MVALAITLFTGCGSSSSDDKKNDGKGAIDLAEYFPSKSMTKTISVVERDGDDVDKLHHDEIIKVTGQTITTTIDTELSEKIVISDTNITTTDLEDNETYSIYRHVDIGDTIFSAKKKETENTDLGKITYNFNANCKIKSKESKFEKNDNVYTGDLLKIECITDGTIIYDIKPSLISLVAKDLNGSHDFYSTSYSYLKKGLGEVALIDDNCIPNGDLLSVIDDRKSGEECKKENVYEYKFYLP